MISYIFQGILFIMIIALIIINKDKASKGIRILGILACSLSLVNTILNLIKLFLAVGNVDLYNSRLYRFFGVSTNILSALFLSLLVIIFVLVLLKITNRKSSENTNSVSKPYKKFTLIAVFMIFVCLIVSFIEIPNIEYNITLYSDLMDTSENKEINIQSNNDNAAEVANEILYKLDNDYITNDVNELISELKNCKDIKLNFVDENVEAYTSGAGSRVYYNYIKPIASDKVIKNNRTRMFFDRPEVGIYTIVNFEYLYLDKQELSCNNVILIFGYADRGGIFKDLSFDKEEVVYIYSSKEVIKLPKIGFCSLNKYDYFEYFYEFVGEEPVY